MTFTRVSTNQPGNLIGVGRTADVHTWGMDQVLKLYKSWMPAAAVEREYNVTRAARHAGLPVPEAIQLLECDGRYGIIFERIQGISLMGELQRHPWRLHAIACQLAELHVQINRCQPPPGLPSQHEQIIFGIQRTSALTPAKKERVFKTLAELPEGANLCHGDFHPENVLLTDHGPVIIDWLTGTFGSPAADLMRSVLVLQTSALPPSIPPVVRFLFNNMRTLLINTYQRRYLQLTPQPAEELNAWQLPLLATRLFEVENYPLEKEMILQRIDKILSE